MFNGINEDDDSSNNNYNKGGSSYVDINSLDPARLVIVQILLLLLLLFSLVLNVTLLLFLKVNSKDLESINIIYSSGWRYIERKEVSE